LCGAEYVGSVPVKSAAAVDLVIVLFEVVRPGSSLVGTAEGLEAFCVGYGLEAEFTDESGDVPGGSDVAGEGVVEGPDVPAMDGPGVRVVGVLAVGDGRGRDVWAVRVEVTNQGREDLVVDLFGVEFFVLSKALLLVEPVYFVVAAPDDE